MINATLKVNSSPVEKIGKTLTTGTLYQCRLKDDTSVLKPVLIIGTLDNLSGFNYLYIAEFNRYYFIDDIVSVNQGVWEVSAHVDVLETYATSIKSNNAVIKRQQSLYNLYLNDPDFMTYNYDIITTRKFTGGSGFNKTLNYVLVINGS